MQEDMADMLPAIEEANSISAELDKKKKFEMVLISPDIMGKKKKGKSQVSAISNLLKLFQLYFRNESLFSSCSLY